MPSHRIERVREMLKREIGEVIRRELPVDEAGLISVNDVDVAGDLKSATVFVSIFGNPNQKKRGMELLGTNRAHIQWLMAKAIVLKYTPTLRFEMDDTIGRGNKVLQIIDELEKKPPTE